MKRISLKLLRAYFDRKISEQQPKKMKLVQHTPNGAMFLEGKRINHAQLQKMKEDNRYIIVEVGKPKKVTE